MRLPALSRCAPVRRAAAALVLAAALVGAAPALAQAAGGPGHIVGLRAHADASATVVEVVADRPLSFTTLRLLDPARVVLDFAETGLSSIPAEIVVEDGTVRRIGAAAAGSRTARVVIELAAEAEFDVHAAGPRFEVRISRSAPSLATRGPDATAPAPSAAPPSGAAPPSAPEATPPATVEAARPEALPPGAVSWVEVPPEPAEAAAAPPVAVPAAAAEPVSVAAAPPPPPARVEPAPLPAPATVAAAPAPAPARMEALAAPAPAAARTAAPSAVDAGVAREREKRDSLPTVSIVGPDASVALAEPLADASAPQPAEAPGPSGHLGQTVVAAPAAPPRFPAPATALRSRSPAASAASAPAFARRVGRKAAISGIGFKPEGQGVVLVRSDRQVEYSVTRGERAVLLHFDSTTIPVANNRLPLDTRFFAGPVERVVPIASAGGTDVRIELREAADFRVQQTQGLLTVTFTR